MGDAFVGSLDQEVEARKWEYDEGDKLVGKVVDIIDGDGAYGPYKGYVVEPEVDNTTEEGGSNESVSTDDQLIFYVNENSAVRRSIPASGIHVGDRLGVRYVGEREAKSGQTFKKFNVRVQSALLSE